MMYQDRVVIDIDLTIKKASQFFLSHLLVVWPQASDLIF